MGASIPSTLRSSCRSVFLHSESVAGLACLCGRQSFRERISRMKELLFAVVASALLVSVSADAQRGGPASDLPKVNAAAMLKTAKPDLDKRLAQFKQVRMPFDAGSLNQRERQMVDQLVVALHALESM